MMTTDIVPSYDPRDPYAIRDGVATRWLTKDKRSLLIAEMADQHLLNTIRFLERQLKARHESALFAVELSAMFRPDSASGLVASSEADLAMARFSGIATLAEPVLKGLRAELQRRGLSELVP